MMRKAGLPIPGLPRNIIEGGNNCGFLKTYI